MAARPGESASETIRTEGRFKMSARSVLPRNPRCDVAATEDEVQPGVKLTKINLALGLVTSFAVDSVSRRAGKKFVLDANGATWGLEFLGIIPGETGEWSMESFTIVHTPDNVQRVIGLLEWSDDYRARQIVDYLKHPLAP